MSALGTLQKVDLRSQWKNEAQDFTPWLAQPENIRLLGEELGLDLETEKREQEVGSYSADILCREGGSERWVVIENQLEPTDHSHLGQILTYAAGLDASAVIWVAERFTNEHRAALDWLNEHTDEQLSFFGVEVELWRIGESLAAPRFNVVCKPNDWSRTIQASARSTELTEAKRTQLAFWTAYRDYLAANSHLRCQKPGPQHWSSTSIGRRGAHLSSIASFWDSKAEAFTGGEIRVELSLDDNNAKAFFRQLEAHRNTIESELGEPLTWHNQPNARSCRIFVRKAADIADESAWPKHHAWLKDKLEAFERVFGPRLKGLKADEAGV